MATTSCASRTSTAPTREKQRYFRTHGTCYSLLEHVDEHPFAENVRNLVGG